VIEGSIHRGEQQGKFHLVRVANIDRKLLDRYVGAFRFDDPQAPDKSQLSLITYGARGYLRWVNLKTGETTGLFPISDKTFVFAFAVIASPSPENATWTFETSSDGEITRSIARVKGQPDKVGLPARTYHQELLKIKNGDATLAATLVMPAAKGKHPVAIFVPGSQALSRDESAPFREFDTFIRNGVGLLIYDKRGTGMSSGDWQRQSFEELASDVLAGVALLKRRKDVDSKRIGAWGFSQGGSIAPLAASQSKDIAFLIIASGGGTTPPQAEINEQVARMRVQKLSPAEIDEAVAFMNLQFDVVRHPDRWSEFQAAAAKVKDKKWYRYTWGGLPKDHWQWNWWRPVVDFDPFKALSRI
jgi:pimeloyl-ACP methyl ester carboxylesterase